MKKLFNYTIFPLYRKLEENVQRDVYRKALMSCSIEVNQNKSNSKAFIKKMNWNF